MPRPSSPPPAVASPASFRRALALLLLVTVTLLGVSLFLTLPAWSGWLGFGSPILFFDSHAVLAACDAVRAGFWPGQSNPYDLANRPHVYSDWWLALGSLGLTRQHNLLVGGSWVLGFLAVSWATLRPKTWREALGFSFLLLAPPMLLAVDRANNDLVVFGVLGLGAIGIHRAPRRAWLAAALAIAVATGLKFYPLLALPALLVLRPQRRMLWALGATAAAVALVLLDVGADIGRGYFPLPPSLYTVGTPVLLGDLGFTGKPALAGAAAIIALGSAALAWLGWTTGLADERQDFDRRLLFALGATLLTGCFVVAASYGYRWIFAVWLAPWLGERAVARDGTRAQRWSARLTLTLLGVTLWADGLFCLGTNFLPAQAPAAQVLALQRHWRLATQPLSWVLVMFLGGWLLQLLAATVADGRRRAASAET